MARKPLYTGDWAAVSRATIARHVAQHGWTCPGWGIPAHASSDLTTDHGPHGLRVLCRGCNSTRANASRSSGFLGG